MLPDGAADGGAGASCPDKRLLADRGGVSAGDDVVLRPEHDAQPGQDTGAAPQVVEGPDEGSSHLGGAPVLGLRIDPGPDRVEPAEEQLCERVVHRVLEADRGRGALGDGHCGDTSG